MKFNTLFKNYQLCLEESQIVYYHGTTSKLKSRETFSTFKKTNGIRTNNMTGNINVVSSDWIFVTKDRELARIYAISRTEEMEDKSGDIYYPTILNVKINKPKLNILDLSNPNTFESNLENINISPIEYWGMGMYDITQMYELLDDSKQSQIIKNAGFNAVQLLDQPKTKKGISLALDINDKTLFKIISSNKP